MQVTDRPRHGADPGLGYGAPSSPGHFTRLDGTATTADDAPLAEEVPIAFVYGGRSHAVMMATPEHIEDLAVGFTLSEGLVSAAAEIGDVRVVRHSRGIEAHIPIPPDAEQRLTARARTIPGRTGCGLCGVEAIDDALRPVPVVASALHVPRSALFAAGTALVAAQSLNHSTRAVHAAAWATTDGALAIVREDVGRHNALDKVLGALVASGRSAGDGFVVITSRASVEMVQKAAVLGIPMLAAVSRPTGLAVRLAARAQLTLVGLLRGTTANVYTHPERILAG